MRCTGHNECFVYNSFLAPTHNATIAHAAAASSAVHVHSSLVVLRRFYYWHYLPRRGRRGDADRLRPSRTIAHKPLVPELFGTPHLLIRDGSAPRALLEEVHISIEHPTREVQGTLTTRHRCQKKQNTTTGNQGKKQLSASVYCKGVFLN